MRAVLERDFVHESSRSTAFRARTYLGTAVALATVLVVAASHDLIKDSPDVVGLRVFAWGGAVLLAMLALVTPAIVVGAVLVERLQETLPLVLASPVGPTRFALAKLLARWGTSLSFGLAAVPPLALAVLFGGVSGSSVLTLAGLCAAVVLEMSAWALLLSTHSRKLATASLLAYVLPLVRWVGTFILVATFRGYRSVDWAPGRALLLLAWDTTPLPGFLAMVDRSQFLRLADDLGRGFGPGDWTFSFHPLLLEPLLLYGATSLVLAWWAVRFAGRRLARESEPRGGAGTPRSLKRRLLRSPPGSGNPVAWKEGLLMNTAASRPLFYTLLLFILVSGVLVIREVHGSAFPWGSGGRFVYGFGGRYPSPHLETIAGWMTAYATAIGLLAVVTGAAAVAHERTQGTWDLLRASPLTLRQIAGGKLRGVLRGVGFVALPAVALPFILQGMGHLENGWTKVASLLLIALLAVFWTAVGMVVGIRTARPGHAVTLAVLIFAGAQLAPLLAGGLANGLMFILGISWRPGEHITGGSPLLLLRRSIVALETLSVGSAWWVARLVPGRDTLPYWAAAYVAATAWLLRNLPRILRRGLRRDGEGG